MQSTSWKDGRRGKKGKGEGRREEKLGEGRSKEWRGEKRRRQNVRGDERRRREKRMGDKRRRRRRNVMEISASLLRRFWRKTICGQLAYYLVVFLKKLLI